MPTRFSLPTIAKCCGCVPDLRTAVAIIAVMGIVTSPAISWAVVRHSYVIRVSCFVTKSEVRPDIVDINLHNIISFGFGSNAGLGPSCLGPNKNSASQDVTLKSRSDPNSSVFVTSVKIVGWFVLLVDVFFIGACIYFLFKIFHGSQIKATKFFMWTAIASIVMSFIYGMLFVAACISVGGAFPIFEFMFTFVDVLLLCMWLYFIIVIHSYIQIQSQALADITLAGEVPMSWWEYIYSWLNFLWIYFLIVVRSYRIKYTPPSIPEPV